MSWKRKYLILILLAVATVALVLSSFSPALLPPEEEISFAEGFNAMNALFEKHRVLLFTELPSEEEVDSLGPDSLNALSSELKSYKREIYDLAQEQDKDALLKLNSIYLLELKYYDELKENKNTLKLDDSKDICKQLYVLKQNDADLESLVKASKNMSNAISGFIEDYPEQNEIAKFFPLDFDEKKMTEAVSNQKNSTAYLEEACTEVAQK